MKSTNIEVKMNQGTYFLLRVLETVEWCSGFSIMCKLLKWKPVVSLKRYCDSATVHPVLELLGEMLSRLKPAHVCARLETAIQIVLARLYNKVILSLQLLLAFLLKLIPFD